MTELQEAQRILLSVAQMATSKDLPKTGFELCKRIWTAFNIGRRYQLLHPDSKGFLYDDDEPPYS